jgi:hypothetical protein
MSHDSSIVPAGETSFTRLRKRKLEAALVALIFLWALVVFAILIYGSFAYQQHAVDVMPTVIPTPKS